jgi:hypothetical protein
MKLHEEFKLYEKMWESATTTLTEARSAADIEADIARLERELAAAKAELLSVRKANLRGKLPAQLYTWDAYKTVAEKGTWTSEIVHETPEAAKAAGEAIVANNLEPGETFDQYTIEVVAVPFSTISNDTLEDSGLDHLIR